MDSLYLLIPLSALLVLALVGLFGWALHRGQFDDLDREGERILEPDPLEPAAVDADQGAARNGTEQSSTTKKP